MLPVAPNVAPTINLELDVDDGEVENYEVGRTAAMTVFNEPGPERIRFLTAFNTFSVVNF